ncbi:hypothetical protein HPP92_020587 [Vanilla planifolia]|uniref:Fe2OG dioxygenase domain-containing protein n=1 Tax=Vanilla planifolia TaxID=51239 RepID=A0A835PX59_VANPL|nr:hypothetical protein HPP92_020587 [Vanilla planifolia]
MDGEGRFGWFGGSIRVESVQALADRLGGEPPERYLRPEAEDDVVIAADMIGGGIPVIDIGKLAENSFDEEEAAKLHSACVHWGFFQIVNHGIPKEIMKKMKDDINEFFKLPMEEKEKVSQSPQHIEGYGQNFVHSKDQKLDWGDMLFLLTLPSCSRIMRYWPTKPSSFRETLEDYSTKLKEVAVLILHVMSTNLELESHKLPSMFKNGSQSMRFNYYPPCAKPNKVIGLSPHSDASGLTLLLQANETQGLQIKRNETWLAVESIPGALIVNIGDTIEILSNGKYKSIEHRAVVCKEERLSIAAFHSLNIDDAIGPIPELVQGKELYKSMGCKDYTKQVLVNKLDGKSNLDRMKLPK